MRPYELESLSHDAIHGYIPFTSSSRREGESTERQVIDHPWVQRLRSIHQLQTAWWVFPTAEHTRFQHVLGAMHLGSRVVQKLYDTLRDASCDAPSRGYVETLLRMAGLLHDVGHGPFGHFFDEHFLRRFKITHETLGALIIQQELGDLLRGLRRNPHSELAPGERLDPAHVAWLITRPAPGELATVDRALDHVEIRSDAGPNTAHPQWLRMLRSLLSGIYTIDNMDFVLRDAYMSGYSPRAFDVDRLLHYSFFSKQGLTIHDRGVDALVRFMSVRAELFRSVYFHRTVRAIDLTLKELFAASGDNLFPGDPREHLDQYLEFTESSLLVDVARWSRGTDPVRRELGERWRALLRRQVPWRMACQRNLVFAEGESEASSIFSDPTWVERKILERCPSGIEIRVDIARHIHRPHTRGPAAGQNFLYDSAQQRVRPLTTNELFDRLPVSHRICRVYARDTEHAPQITAALDGLIHDHSPDDLTNM